MTTAAASMTADELFDLPADNLRHELVRGELTTMPPTGGEHGLRTFNLAAILGPFIKANKLGVGLGAETGFLLARNPDTVRAPDCAFVQASRVPPENLRLKFWPLAPDLAVEVLSPSDTASEVLEKIDEWLAAGTRLVWVVDPERKSVTVYRPGHQPTKLRVSDFLVGEDVLPGFQVSVAEIFS